ncbi:MAG: hypothetical protein PVJ76_07560 [Gemmatimonadota bacterium]
MVTGSRIPALFGCALIVSGCAVLSNPARSSRTHGGIRNENGATIISGRALDDRRGSLLDTMEGRVPGMQIQRHPDRCPEVTLRSHIPYNSPIDPLIYVDGTRTGDTCILNQLTTDNVESIEIYPMGVTMRPGYATHAHGLILVFLRGAGK